MKSYCESCGEQFVRTLYNKKYCSEKCRSSKYYSNESKNYNLNSAAIGAISELITCADLLKRGYAVFRSVSPSCFCDVIAYKNNKSINIEIRTGKFGTDGKLQWTKKTHHEVDIFAVVDRYNDKVFYKNKAGEDFKI